MRIRPMEDGCLYLGDTITYKCRVVGKGTVSVVWKGSAFSCPQANNDITLLSQENATIIKSCNNETISGKIVRADENGTLISQLNVTLTDEVIGKGLECAYNDGITEDTVGSLNVAESYGKFT